MQKDPAEWIMDKWSEEVLKNPENVPEKMHVMTLTPQLVLKLFTPSRAALLREVANGHCKTIQELSQKLKRPVPAVSRDLSDLEFHGLVELKRHGKTKKPSLSKQLVVVPLTGH